MPPKKESPQQKADRLQAQGDSIRMRADFVVACASIKHNPAAIDAVKTLTVRKGEWGVYSGKCEVPSAHSKGDSEEAAQSTLLSEEDFQAMRQDALARYPDLKELPNLNFVLHHNFCVWRLVPPTHLAALLSVVEPISLHQNMLKTLCSKGSRVIPKDPMLEVLEWITDHDAGDGIGECKDLIHLAAVLMDKNKERGRRAESLRLPPNWERDGHWKLIRTTGNECLLCRLWQMPGETKVQVPLRQELPAGCAL